MKILPVMTAVLLLVSGTVLSNAGLLLEDNTLLLLGTVVVAAAIPAAIEIKG